MSQSRFLGSRSPRWVSSRRACWGAVVAGLMVSVGGAGCGTLAPGIRYPGLPTAADGALHIVNFDVGQADAMLVIYKGKTLLFDCGSPNHSPLRSSQVIPRRLDALLGHRHIDYFVISHFHQDHMGTPGGQRNKREPSGIYALLERDDVTIGTIIDRGDLTYGRPGATQRHYMKWLPKWIERGVVKERRSVAVGDSIDLGEGLKIGVMSSNSNGLVDRMHSLFPDFLKKAPPSENDLSVSLKLTLGDFELFTGGDLSGQSIVRSFGPVSQSYTDVESRVAAEVGAVEVYHVDHHGSGHSSNPCFAEVLRPQVSIFSTGDNRYGHPDISVYHRLKSYGRAYITGGADDRVYDTVARDIVGQDVEVLVAPDGERYWVNGEAQMSLSDAEEAARPGARERCEALPEEVPTDYNYKEEVGDAPTD